MFLIIFIIYIHICNMLIFIILALFDFLELNVTRIFTFYNCLFISKLKHLNSCIIF